ncbi:MAG: hypothetical protein ABSF77_09655 [Spirochaetia bacterium]
MSGKTMVKTLVNAIVDSVVRSKMAKQNALVADGLYAGLCGTGSPLPDKNRAAACKGSGGPLRFPFHEKDHSRHSQLPFDP